MWVDVDDLRSLFFRLDHVREANGMSLRHVAAHDEDAVAALQVCWKHRSTATTKCGTQTGYRCAVSNTGLIFNGDNTESSIKKLLNKVVFFHIERCTTK